MTKWDDDWDEAFFGGDDSSILKDGWFWATICGALLIILFLATLWGGSKTDPHGCTAVVSGLDVATGSTVVVQVQDERLCS